MKKTVTILSLAAVILMGSGGAAQAESDFKIGADLVSSYVWRGGELGNSPAIQPALTYTVPGSKIVIGAWGSYGINENSNGYRYKETDLYATIPAGAFSLTVTDYYVVPTSGSSKTFDFSSDGPNVVELSLAYSNDNLNLLAAVNVAGNEGNTTNGVKNAKYFEAGYKLYNKDGYNTKVIVGAGDKDYYGKDYGIAKNKKIAVVNTGISISKDRYTASYIYNPDTENSNLVFMASF
ncbi:MAG: hypothetical protein WCK32_07275 [Chlorobiaceae bacterium]